MAWLEAHQELRDHPKIKRAARALGVSRPQMIGHMLCLWWWCLDYAYDGDLSDFDNADIADAAAWEGDPDIFVNALIDCGPADRPGLLVSTSEGVMVNDWEEYGGKYITKRNQSRDRQRTYRQRNADVTRDKGVSNDAREEEIREEKMREEWENGVTYPPGFDEFERNFRLNLINAVKERDPRQSMAGGFSLSDASKAVLLQAMTSGPVLSAAAIEWALDQWEAAKPKENFRVQDKGCINWLLTTVANSYKPTRRNGKPPATEKLEVTHIIDPITGKVIPV